ncbi:glutathione S-transferase N-terminal domain-containing protein [Agarilytica rhodophyticola]|uniref:glutathione S-transferase N-terminal domain-containing protein n=1 Tax=Agarilytica rhodophyticola TaxID=1737490 RepID=UPI000B349519|nr:glutathione S-transferase N-terminal domain-containing protein [Agarilytica rhodophyticola]
MNNTLELYSLATPNGQKASIALEEMELPYNANTINIIKGEQFNEGFLKINPNRKVPVLVDPIGDNGKHLAIMESGAILLYLAEKTGKFIPSDPAKRSRELQWLFFQMGGVGPMFGQFGHFYKYATEKCKHPYPEERYAQETMRLLSVMENQLSKNKYLAGDELSIADFATAPWVICLKDYYIASERLELLKYTSVNSWIEELRSRPTFERGLNACYFD